MTLWKSGQEVEGRASDENNEWRSLPTLRLRGMSDGTDLSVKQDMPAM